MGRLLCVLAAHPRGMAELARGPGVGKAALPGLVDRVDRRGLAERAAVPGDRRAVQVTLTDAGQRTALDFHAEVTGELNRLLDPLAPGDREQFRAATATIASAAGLSGGWAPCRPC